MHWFTLLFITFLVLSLLTRYWLSFRQMKHVADHRGEVPDAFSAKISLQDHQKAADYTLAKLKFSQISYAWEAVILLVWTLGGGIEFIDSLIRSLELSPLLSGISVLVGVMLISGLIDLPFSLYSTFVLEEKFGFNKTTIKTWFVDLLKSTLLTVIIGVPLLAAVLWLMNQAGEYWWLYAWGLWTTFTLLMIWAYPAFIAPLFNKFTPLSDESLKTRISNLLHKCGFKSKGVFVVDGSRRSAHGNAYFTGFGNNKRIVFYDTLLDSLSEDEVEAVLAHELGHFKRNHIRKSILLSLTMTLAGFALLAWLMNSAWFYNALGVSTPSTYVALLLFVLVSPVFTYFISPLFSALSRKHEFEADEFAKQQSDARDLVSALVNMYRDNASTLTPDPVHSMFYDSHPPASIRIAHLQSS